MSSQPTSTDTVAPYTISADLPVSPDEAFALITEPERLRRWKTVSARVDLQAGGAYRFTVTPGHVAAGTYREVEPGRRIVFGWGWEGDDGLPPDTSTVTVTIEPTDTGSRVTLVHEGLDAQQAIGHAEGWKHFFARLQRFATTGDAGPDEWAAAPDPIDPIVAAEATLAVLQPVLRRLTAEDQPKPTPCEDFTCHALAVHLMESIVSVGAMAGADVGRPETGSLESKVSDMAEQAFAAWHRRGLEGTITTANGGELPAAVGPSILAVEFLLHGWDLAQATGQTVVAADALVDYVRELAEPLITDSRGTAFADEVQPAAGMGALERLAAYAGRVQLAG